VWAYCHVPPDCGDMTDRIARQIERFAPGFRDRIRAAHVLSPVSLQRRNANLVGGDIMGGSQDLAQMLARPKFRRVPYATPDPGLWLCSASTPPGGGVHGMCGWHAARAMLRRVFGIRRELGEPAKSAAAS
jgi:phytoene dehydrogenase-like protein